MAPSVAGVVERLNGVFPQVGRSQLRYQQHVAALD